MTQAKNRRILIIDDNRSIHEDFCRILGGTKRTTDSLDAIETMLFGNARSSISTEEFEIDSAYQGEEGFLMIQRARDEGRPYSLAFVDIRMPPGWDGVETIEQIWEVDPDIQLVICSAYSDHTADEILERLGLSDRLLLLKKPCDFAEILLITATLNEKWNLANGCPAAMA